jgi:probable DNA metabolism protein
MDKEMEDKILICEDSLEGILTGVYEAFVLKNGHKHTFLQIGEEENLRLFAEYRMIDADPLKAEKVVRTMRTRFGEEAYQMISQAAASEDRQKAQAIYQTIVLGLSDTYKGRVMDCLWNEAVAKVFELSRASWNELHHFYGFLRFEELENGILYGKISPKNNIVPYLGPHFADRFPLENFLIYDIRREIFLVHPANKTFFIITKDHMQEQLPLQISEKEKEMRQLFQFFCEKIAIRERENLHLQRQMLPLRFQENMVEFEFKRHPSEKGVDRDGELL